MLHALLQILALMALSQIANAKEVKVGEVRLDLSPPPGFCELEPSQRSDARLIKAVEGMLNGSGNELLAIAANCNELKDWRGNSHKLLDHLVQYQTMKSLAGKTVDADLVKQACEQMRANGEKFVADDLPRLKSRAEEVMNNVQVNDSKFLGVLAEDNNACYSAVLQKFKAETGQVRSMVVGFVTTTIKGKLLYVYFIDPYESSESVTQVLSDLKDYLPKLAAVNAR